MRVTEKLVNSPEEEGVTLEYIRLTKDFEEIKEYVRHKGDTLTGYWQTKEKVSVRIEDILYFETVDGLVFAYTVDSVYEIKGRLYQVEEKVNKRNICRASKTMLINVEHIISVRTALNGRLYARMENGEEISTFSVVVFNAVLGIELLRGSLNDNQHEKNNRKKAKENYPVLNGDRDTANVLVTLPDGSKGWTDGLGNGYIR